MATALQIGARTKGQTPCPVCQSQDAIVIALRDRNDQPLITLFCETCSLTRSDPLPSQDELDAFYAAEYRKVYKGVAVPKQKHIYRAGRLAKARLAKIAPHLHLGTTLLDIGASSGEWLYALNRCGHHAIGIEANEGYARFGQESYGVDIQIGSVYSMDLGSQRYQCVTMFHVLEHLPDPLGALRRIQQVVNPDGLLWIEVPHAHSLHQHPGKRFHYGHVIGFNPMAIRYTLTQAGWRVIKCQEDEYGRNLWVLATPAATSQPLEFSPEPPLFSDRASVLGYFLRPSTFHRSWKRMLQFVREKQKVRASLTAREVLELALR